MTMMRTVKKNHKLRVSLMALYFLGVGYFSYHALSGERGALAMMALNRQVDGAKSRLETIRKDRQSLEYRVSLMRPKSLDLDVLDEQVRYQMGLANPDELVILTDK